MSERRLLLLLLIGLVVTLPFASLRLSLGEEDSWTTKAAMPTPRSGFGVAVVNGKIYAIGGRNSVSDLHVTEEYDPKTNTWNNKTRMPTARFNFAIFVFQNKIHVIGGQFSGEFTRAHEVYDPATDTWETLTPVANKLRALCDFDANVVNGKAYIISGAGSIWPPYPSDDSNQAYDPLTEAWTDKSPIPSGVIGYASAAYNEKIFIFGGRDMGKDTTYKLTQIYDVGTDSWSSGAPVPTGLSGAGGAITSGVNAPKRMYVMGGFTCLNRGGFTPSEHHNLNQVYDPEKDEWSTGAHMPTNRSGLGLAVVDDVLYAIGGFDGTHYLNVNEQYTPLGYTTPQPTPSPEPTPKPEPFPTTLLIVSAFAVVAVVGLGLLVYFKRRNRTLK